MAILSARPVFYPPVEDVDRALAEFGAFPKKKDFSGYHQVRDLTVQPNIEDLCPGLVSPEKLEEVQQEFLKTGKVPDEEWVKYWMSKSDEEIYNMISPENPRALVPNYSGGYPLKQGNITSLVPIWGKPNQYYSVLDRTEWGPGRKVKNPATGQEVEIVDDGKGWKPPEGFPIRSEFKFVAAYRNYLIRKLVFFPYNGERNFDGPNYREHASPLYAIAYAYAVTRDQRYADRVLLILNRLAENYRYYTSNEDTGWGWGWYPWRGYIDDHNFECGFVINMVLSYDLVWSGIPEAEKVVQFFNGKKSSLAEEGTLTTEKLAANIERNLFGYTWEYLRRCMMGSGGNMLARQIQTSLIVASVFQNDNIVNHVLNGPKNLNDFIIGGVNRDGQFWEDSSFYAGKHVRGLLLDIQKILSHYHSPGYEKGVALEPAAVAALEAARKWPDVWEVDGRTLGVGDAPVPRGQILTPPAKAPGSADGHEVGYTLMRQGEAAPSRETVLLYHGNSGFGHGHSHQLMMKIFGYGYDFSADLGYPANFSVNKWPDWTKATLSHPTVVVDQKSQNESTASVGIRGQSPWAQVVSAFSLNVYQGVPTYHRTVALLEVKKGRRLIVDIFRVSGGSVHDYSVHSMSGEKGNDFSLSAADQLKAVSGTLAGADVKYGAKGYAGYSFLTDLREGPVAGSFTGIWKPSTENKVGFRVTVPAGFDGKVIAAKGEAEGNMGLSPWDAYLILRREGKEPLSSTFVAVYDVSDGEPLDFTVEQLPSTNAPEKMPVRLKLTLADGTAWFLESALAGTPQSYDLRGHESFKLSGPTGEFSINRKDMNPVSGKIEAVDYANRAMTVSSDRDLSNFVGQSIFIKNPGYTKTTSFEVASAERIGASQWRLVVTQPPIIAKAVIKALDTEKGEIVSERITEKLFGAVSLLDGKTLLTTPERGPRRVKRASITGISQPDPIQRLKMQGKDDAQDLSVGESYSVYDFGVGDDYYFCDIKIEPNKEGI